MLHSTPIPQVPLDKPPKEQPTQVHGLNITPEEMESLRQAFRIFDIKGAGTISLTEFGKIIENLNIATSQSEIQSIAHAVDLNNDQMIDFEEFATAMIRHLTPDPHQSHTTCFSSSIITTEPQSYYYQSATTSRPRTILPRSTTTKRSSKRISFYDDLELVQCFQAFDKNRDGLISRKELEDVMISLGEHLTPQEIKAMMDDADRNGDGYIDFDEFKHLLPA
ncbi:hypothetical protein BDA99DRAFT_523412 [Phascolomyces articulosus]|uniref:EF-hand domain-containing protein n=1 Tax=Phascolomyces articulosus TaxID=60185 RepID=A0AAD5P954_9FUNG|nr:hypothetical protein BDA99DRAFT_523412 [Phascolomyces articulosus]